MIKIDNIDDFVQKIEKKCKKQFEETERIALYNQEKVLRAFRRNEIQARHFYGTTGYGYGDIGREALNRVFADAFEAEDAIVSPLISSGTHALTLVLFGLLRPGDVLLSATGDLYDTLNDVIFGENNGSLRDFGVSFDKVNLKNNAINLPALMKKVAERRPKCVFIQRSRGYNRTAALSMDGIEKAVSEIKAAFPDTFVAVDNCYGEFTDWREPTTVRADVVCGSLIKNPGGGIAPTGAYIAGTEKAVKLISDRFTAPGIGTETGSFISGYMPYFQGIFLAPAVVKNAIKGGILFGRAYAELGYETFPKPGKPRYDTVTSIKFGTEDELVEFIRAIQAASPVDSNVVPYPWDMPGYREQVIMASGAFVQGSSIELSADSPIKEPYFAYLQGGLTYEHAKIALKMTLRSLSGK